MLPHINIVQKLLATKIKSTTGEAVIDLPAGFNTDNQTIMGFIQNIRDGSILAVTGYQK